MLTLSNRKGLRSSTMVFRPSLILNSKDIKSYIKDIKY